MAGTDEFRLQALSVEVGTLPSRKGVSHLAQLGWCPVRELQHYFLQSLLSQLTMQVCSAYVAVLFEHLMTISWLDLRMRISTWNNLWSRVVSRLPRQALAAHSAGLGHACRTAGSSKDASLTMTILAAAWARGCFDHMPHRPSACSLACKSWHSRARGTGRIACSSPQLLLK